MNEGKKIPEALSTERLLPKRNEGSSPQPPDFPAAGPHAKRELTNKMATPGAGALPDPDEEGDCQTSTG